MAKNLMGKTRPVNDPYRVFRAGDWEWRVLKAYSADESKPFARWFCAVKSPMTFGSYDLGDVYISEVLHHATEVLPVPNPITTW